MKATKRVETQPEIEDVQSSKDTRQIAINKVGIKDIRHPVKVKDRSDGYQHTVANFNMYVNLPHNFKGTHMSRFVEILNAHDKEISVESFKGMLSEMAERLEANAGHIEMHFPYFINKEAPISKVRSLMDYEVTLIGEIHKGRPSMMIKVVVPVTSLCPVRKRSPSVAPTISVPMSPFRYAPTDSSGSRRSLNWSKARLHANSTDC